MASRMRTFWPGRGTFLKNKDFDVAVVRAGERCDGPAPERAVKSSGGEVGVQAVVTAS